MVHFEATQTSSSHDGVTEKVKTKPAIEQETPDQENER